MCGGTCCKTFQRYLCCQCFCVDDNGVTKDNCCARNCNCLNTRKDKPLSTDHINGPIERSKRKCTDLYCSILFLIFVSIVIFSVVHGFWFGNLRNIAQPFDVDGNACGRDALSSFKYIFFNEFVPDRNNVSGTVCVASCPKLPSEKIACYPNSEIKNCGEIKTYPSEDKVKRFCISKIKGTSINDFAGKLASVLTTNASTWEEIKENGLKLNKQILGSISISSTDSMFEDIKRCWWAILICIILAIGLSLGFLWFVHACTSCMVYVSYGIFYIGIFVLGCAFFMRYTDLSKNGNSYSWEDPWAYLILAIVVWVIGLLSIIILCCTCEKIKVAIALLKCGGSFLWDNKD